MHSYGGVYADLDFIALRPMQDLFEQQGNNAQVFLGQDCGVELNTSRPRREQACSGYDQSLPNAFLASVPGHDFWNFVIVQILGQAWTSSNWGGP